MRRLGIPIGIAMVFALFGCASSYERSESGTCRLLPPNEAYRILSRDQKWPIQVISREDTCYYSLAYKALPEDELGDHGSMTVSVARGSNRPRSRPPQRVSGLGSPASWCGYPYLENPNLGDLRSLQRAPCVGSDNGILIVEHADFSLVVRVDRTGHNL